MGAYPASSSWCCRPPPPSLIIIASGSLHKLPRNDQSIDRFDRIEID
jgi:hypothetical protein